MAKKRAAPPPQDDEPPARGNTRRPSPRSGQPPAPAEKGSKAPGGKAAGGKGKAPAGKGKAEPAQGKAAGKNKKGTPKDVDAAETIGLRIIGGKFRGRKLTYSGDRTVRPMKDRVREALFNLIGPHLRRMHVLDLFAGTGAVGLEALSRGAHHVTFVERHYPTAAVLRRNIASLESTERTSVISADTFYWWAREQKAETAPRLIFICPPYELFVSRKADLEGMIRQACVEAAPGSVCVVESDERWSSERLAELGEWFVRDYPPARIALLRVGVDPLAAEPDKVVRRPAGTDPRAGHPIKPPPPPKPKKYTPYNPALDEDFDPDAEEEEDFAADDELDYDDEDLEYEDSEDGDEAAGDDEPDDAGDETR